MVEEYCPHVIQMSIQCEQTSSCLVTPHFDLIVVTSGDEEGLRRVEVNAANGAIVFFESVDQGTHAVVP